MKRYSQGLKEDNRGASFIVVVICVMFAGILASAMLLTAYMNYQMKATERGAAVNFSDAESVLNQACAGLQVRSEDALDKAVDHAEKYYAATPQKERTTLVNNYYVTGFFNMLAAEAGVSQNKASSGVSYVTSESRSVKGEKYITLTGSGSGSSSSDGSQAAALCSYLKGLTVEEASGDSDISDRIVFCAGTGTGAGDGTSNNIVIAYNTTDPYVEIRNVCVTYTDDNDYETSITTDIRLSPPEGASGDYFTADQDTENTLVDDYAIIADGTVTAMSGSDASVTGNVYSGGGIKAASSRLTFFSDLISSRQDLEASGSGHITVSSSTAGSTAELWVKNIITSPAEGSASSGVTFDHNTSDANPQSMAINGDCYVADDMLLNLPGYDVSINGDYYGYKTGKVKNSSSESYDGSAIGINAADANLNITGSLWLAGSNILTDEAYLDGSSSKSVREGESLSYKWTQDAYLIPAECIVGAEGQNPMPASLFNKLTGYNSSTNTRGALELDFSKYPFIAQINVETYLDSTQPYIYKFVQQYNATSTENVVYLYMNFSNEASASAYFARYASYLTQRTALTAAANILGYGRVSLSDDVLYGDSGSFTGNLVLFDRDETSDGSAGTGSAESSWTDRFTQQEGTNAIDETGEETDPFRDSVVDEDDSVITEQTASGSSAGTGTDTGTESKSGVTKSYTPYGSLTVAEKNSGVYDSDMINKENELNYQYYGLISLLDKRVQVNAPDYRLVVNLLKNKELYDEMNVIYIPQKGSGEDGSVSYIVKALKRGTNGTVTLDGSSGFDKGIVVADCDINITGSFNGTIITTGNVTLRGSASVKAGYTVGFDNIAGKKEESSGAKRAGVAFRNWRKN